jgi:hypothetical protein
MFAQNFVEDGCELLGAYTVSRSPTPRVKGRGEI